MCGQCKHVENLYNHVSLVWYVTICKSAMNTCIYLTFIQQISHEAFLIDCRPIDLLLVVLPPFWQWVEWLIPHDNIISTDSTMKPMKWRKPPGWTCGSCIDMERKPRWTQIFDGRWRRGGCTPRLLECLTISCRMPSFMENTAVKHGDNKEHHGSSEMLHLGRMRIPSLSNPQVANIGAASSERNLPREFPCRQTKFGQFWAWLVHFKEPLSH